jgi:hypothetical protein
MLDTFAQVDSDGLPAGTSGTLPKRVDLAALTRQYYVLGTMLTQAVAAVGPSVSRGAHGNDEGKLPVYDENSDYEEFGFFKGGGRLVLDKTSGRRYISLHYSTFYRVLLPR